jgi:hypothetical protein
MAASPAAPTSVWNGLARFRDLGVTQSRCGRRCEQSEVLDMIELAGATLIPPLGRL